jgi:hypothetical protein
MLVYIAILSVMHRQNAFDSTYIYIYKYAKFC